MPKTKYTSSMSFRYGTSLSPKLNMRSFTERNRYPHQGFNPSKNFNSQNVGKRFVGESLNKRSSTSGKILEKDGRTISQNSQMFSNNIPKDSGILESTNYYRPKWENFLGANQRVWSDQGKSKTLNATWSLLQQKSARLTKNNKSKFA